MDRTDFRIGELATRAGVSVDAVRYYERLKLLPRAARMSGGFRVFGPESVERVQFIKQAQELGLTLDQIKGLLATGGAEECRKVHDLLSEKLRELDACFLCEGSALPACRVVAIGWLRLLSTLASQAVPMQAEFTERDCPLVLSGCRAHVFSISAAHSQLGCQLPREVKMKRKHLGYGLVAVVVAIALFVVYYLYLGSTAPTGQQPLVRLDSSNIDSFNESADSVRVMVMLSPT